ncbi:MAG: hypothetical protein KDJ47_10430 [Hyphomicrobiaceae bacterium]|nr:hypothetical protein [Hyphomicrobiaceae bacterium]
MPVAVIASQRFSVFCLPRPWRTVPAALVCAIAVLAGPVAAIGAETAALTGQVRLALAQPVFPAGDASRQQSRSLVQPVAGRACRQCRRICYHDYRKGCFEDWCRKQFTQCMRVCWYEYCR